MDASSREQIGLGLGRIPSGLFILTARHQDTRTGMLASWVQQAGFEPPAVSVAVRRGRVIERLIEQSGRFALNQLAAEPGSLLKHFARGFGPDEDVFAGVSAREVAGGIGLSGAMSVLSCDVRGRHDAGDHWLYIGTVVAAECSGDLTPYVHVRRSGLSY